MNLYSNFESHGIPCRIVVDFDERAAVSTGPFYHRLTAEINTETLVERLEVAHSNLTRVVSEYRAQIMQITKIISDPNSDEVIKWLRSNAFSLTDISVQPTQSNTPTNSDYKQPGMLDEY